MSAPTITALGEVLWDVYPDAAHFGGAPANFACHAASLGGEAWIVSSVGRDELGAKAKVALLARTVDCRQLQEDAAHPTGTVQVIYGAVPGEVRYEFASDTAWDHLQW